MIPGKKGWDTGQRGFSTGGEGRVLEDSEVESIPSHAQSDRVIKSVFVNELEKHFYHWRLGLCIRLLVLLFPPF